MTETLLFFGEFNIVELYNLSDILQGDAERQILTLFFIQ